MDLVRNVLNTLDTGAHFVSLALERSLSQTHSFLHSSAASLSLNFDPTAAACNRIAERAWWDSNKGSAVVVWAPVDQDLSHALSLALASIDSRSGPSRAGRPPYTVIVLVPESSDGLAPLISAWAKRKADLTSADAKSPSYPYKLVSSARQLCEAKLWMLLTWFARVLNVDVDSDTPELQEASYSPPSSSPGRAHSEKRRRLSIGGWTAPDVVGYGRDMLKGLQIGGAVESTGVGAIIPVVVDMSTTEGLVHAQSTIQAYCLSHHLLLRALIVIPAVLGGPAEITTKSENRAEGSPKAMPFDDRLTTLANTLDASLEADVRRTLDLLAALVPVLKADGGRVIGLLPTHVHRQASLSFAISSGAMIDLWQYTLQQLEQDGVFTSLIRIASRTSIASAPSSTSIPATTQQLSGLCQLPKLVVLNILLIAYGLYTHSHEATVGNVSLHHKRTCQSHCPPLLLDAVRSALVRSWPRREYAVGLGPRIEQVWRYVPGHYLLASLSSRLFNL